MLDCPYRAVTDDKFSVKYIQLTQKEFKKIITKFKNLKNDKKTTATQLKSYL